MQPSTDLNRIFEDLTNPGTLLGLSRTLRSSETPAALQVAGPERRERVLNFIRAAKVD